MADGYLKVSTEFPGHTVQFSADDGASWRDVSKGLNLTQDVLLRTRSLLTSYMSINKQDVHCRNCSYLNKRILILIYLQI